MKEWLPKLTSSERPLTPYRVMWEFMNLFDREDVMVTPTAAARVINSCLFTRRRLRAVISAGANATLWAPVSA